MGGVATSTRIAVNTGLLRSWLASVTQFTPQEFYAGGVASPTVNPLGGWANGTFQDGIWYMIPRFKFLGVDPTLVAQVAAWAQTLWPTANWTADLNATCWPYQSYASDGTVACSQ